MDDKSHAVHTRLAQRISGWLFTIAFALGLFLLIIAFGRPALSGDDDAAAILYQQLQWAGIALLCGALAVGWAMTRLRAPRAARQLATPPAE